MTRLLHRLLEAWSGHYWVPTRAMLDAAPPTSDCGRLIREALIEARR